MKFREKERVKKSQAENAPLPTPGRPRLPNEEALISTISELAVHGSAADGRRRTEVTRACRTQDDLTCVLKERGYNLSRSATYLRLIPARANTREGKLHVKTAPVKLTRAENDLHKSHPDGQFCVASIRNAKCIASVSGSSEVAVLSKDDKCRIPLGISAATKEAPLLMHMEYRVRLPDHDWVVGSRHKLIPSVYAGIRIINKSPIGQPDAVSYSGPTYVAIRSGKHSSSTATTHAVDFERLIKLENFESILHTSSGEIKPVLVNFVDGGPDENPRYRKVIAETVEAFKAHNLDYVITVTNAPGRSAFNRVERRMAPLSRMLAGLVLEHNHYGAHLDSQGRTVDAELEKQNFEFAGKTLAEVWSTLNIDGESVVAEYIPPADLDESTDGHPGTEWYAAHVRESQYTLQVAKCLDDRCCTPLRSKIRTILPDGFLPPPLLLSDGLEAAQPLSRDCHYAPLFVQLAAKIAFPTDQDPVPYDFYCPTIQNQLKSRCCSICGLYFASQVSVKEHKRDAHNMAALIDVQNRAGTSHEGPGRRSARVAARKGEVLTELQDEVGQPVDVEWVADAAEEGDEWDDNIPLSSLISNTAEWARPLWTED
ncbi:hypothetical protein ONE63_001642 [Megalurothrips usitatus]|uniref:C2H2-type domain-containing protein n=1 Tax=Megalurothrips usitatus TaxID=439358 RepID=A0AAV7X918_9NEOP|nr:hypothetical protein ONE63_001642 [Megalurothrips usitatus]